LCPSGVRIGFDLGNSYGEAPLVTIAAPGGNTFGVAAFSDWNMAVATLVHLFQVIPLPEGTDWSETVEWVKAVHDEALRREVAAREARQGGGS
jgi:hypothetical protein